MTRATLARLIAAIVALTVVIAVPMTRVHWNGIEASTQAGKIDALLIVMIVLSSFVYSIVLVMLGYSIWRYRAKPGDESDGEPIHGNTKLEIAWTAIPTAIVLFGAIYSWITLSEIEAKSPDPLRVNVTAQQFTWHFAYPSGNGPTIVSDTLHVPVDRQVDLHLWSLDVIHSLWVPEWRIKRDAVPTSTPGASDVDNDVVVTPNRLGRYEAICAELCGFGHATMRRPVVVQPRAQFDSWLATEQRTQKGPSQVGPDGFFGESMTSGAAPSPSAGNSYP